MRQTYTSGSNTGLPVNIEITFSTLQKMYLYYQMFWMVTNKGKNRSVKFYLNPKRKKNRYFTYCFKLYILEICGID